MGRERLGNPTSLLWLRVNLAWEDFILKVLELAGLLLVALLPLGLGTPLSWL
jgi:hypothetical protein